MEAEEEMMHNTHEDRKRKMKTPLQLETLERVFAEEKYPSEAIRARLSIQLGLSNRQLKMWFCHRRLKERKSKEEDEEPGSSDKSPQQVKETPTHRGSTAVLPSPMYRGSTAVFPLKKEEQLSGGSCHSQDDSAWKFRRRPEAIVEKEFDSAKRKRSRQTASNSVDPWRVSERQAIASVEAQLGEPLRWDSPCLGIEFDPLPPGAFSSPAVPSQHHKPLPMQDPRSRFESKTINKPDLKLQRDPVFVEYSQKTARTRKSVASDSGQNINGRSGSRLLQEYQFIPERPTGRDGMTPGNERSAHSKVFLGPENARQSLMLQSSFTRGSESLVNAFGLEGKPLNAAGGLLLQRDIYSKHILPQPQILHQDSFSNFGYDGHFGGYNNLYHILPANTPLHGSEKLPFYSDHEPTHGNKKRKSEEIRIAKEVEAHRKRIQREIEREEIARRKREEQLQKEKDKEVERMMREKQREDERIQRERQREDERIQREVRRELERQERLVQKEAQRLEREREKEEARRLKEATRLKAAIERATARRLARECVELIDDERLELLEAAATSQCLPSIYLLDGETLQGLDRYKDSLKKFPPAAVKMKTPLAISPWIDSQENLGNLFMVWRFLIAFADVLGLWPFTLDEFVQAFHDYDPRLLAEIHMALIRTIVRDIEDVAKASACGGAVNQYTAPSTIGGGHSQLVEAAFAWGYDYREWSRHLNPSTWPEILRQFSLAAGYGPIWKQQQDEVINGQNGDEGRQIHHKGNAGEQAVNTLRSGAAAVNAVTLMKGKGGSHARKCRYRLTPGTVKYAAFHVLSVEGPNGLSIMEVADRIEKYGLRDLTTSKTPESSIAAALSRDTIFFERVAPSTYCVKASFRKNPEDAERLLQAALERTRLFQSGISDAYDVEKDLEDIDEVEREQDSGDESEDMEVDDVDRALDKGKVTFSLKEGKVIEAGDGKAGDCTGKAKKQDLLDNNAGNTQIYDSRGKHALLSSLARANGSAEDGRERSVQLDKAVASVTDTEIDESHAGEPWVQGLMEGEYSDLSVEERLNALVALVEVVNEGNTVRVALEERMEAATALKRQMWAEAQLDKRRFKEEQLSKSQSQVGEGIKGEGPNMSPGDGDVKTSAPTSIDGTQMTSKNSPPLDKELGIQGCNNNHDASTTGMSGFASEKTRAQLKVDIDFRADELYVFRSLPLGLDRRHNRYWQFVTSYVAEDRGCGRVYFESSEDGHWEVIDTEEAFSALMANLDTRGIREAHLHGVLQKLESLIRQGMRRFASTARPERRLLVNESEVTVADSISGRSSSNGVASTFHAGYTEEDGSSGDGTVLPESEISRNKGAIQIQSGNIQAERQHVLDRYKEFDKWLWSRQTPELSSLVAVRLRKNRSCELLAKCETCHDLYWPQEKHCSSCHATFEVSAKADAKFTQHVNECEKKRVERGANWKLQGPLKLLPSRVQHLKAQILSVEAAIPAEALKSFWTETHRNTWVASLKRASSPGELLQLLTELESAVQRDWLSFPFETTKELLEAASMDTVPGSAVLPWVPRTTAAVALRLMAFDCALFYSAEQKRQSSTRPNKSHLAPGPMSTKKTQNIDTEDLLSSVEERNNPWKDAGIKQPDLGCSTGRHSRSHGHDRTGKAVTKSVLSVEYPEAIKDGLQFSGESHHASLVKGSRGSEHGGGTFSFDKVVMERGRANRTGRHKQPFTQNFDCGEHTRFQRTGGRHEFQTNGRAGLKNANLAKHYEEDEDAISGAEEEDEEELIIEDEYEEEEDGPTEELNQAREGIAVGEEAETDSMEEEDEDEEEDDDEREQEHDMDDCEEDGDGDGDEREDGSSDSHSSDESD